jgi:hypothetical protein
MAKKKGTLTIGAFKGAMRATAKYAANIDNHLAYLESKETDLGRAIKGATEQSLPLLSDCDAFGARLKSITKTVFVIEFTGGPLNRTSMPCSGLPVEYVFLSYKNDPSTYRLSRQVGKRAVYNFVR